MFTRRNLVFAALSVFLLYLLGGILLVPVLTRHLVISKIDELLIPDLEVAKIRTNPLLLSTTLQGIELHDDTNGDFLRLEKAHARISISSLWRLHPVISEIELTKPELFATREKDGSLNWEHLLATVEPSEPIPSTEENETGELPKVTLKRLSIMDGNFQVNDLSPSQEFEQSIGPISFEVLDLSTAGEEAGSYKFSAETPEGASITWQGTLNPSKLETEGNLSIADLAVYRSSPYLIDLLGLELNSASMSVSIKYNASIGPEGPAVEVSEGTYHLHSTELFENDTKAPVASIQDLWVHNISSEPLNNKANVGFVELTGLKAHFNQPEQSGLAEIAILSIEGIKAEGTAIKIERITTSGNNFSLTRHKLPESEENTAAPTPEAAETEIAQASEAIEQIEPAAAEPLPVSIEIAEITWSDTQAVLDDQTVEPAAKLSLTDIKGEITDISSAPDARATINFHAMAIGKAPVSLKGTFNPFPETLFTDLTLDLDDVDVTAFSPYTAKFIGRELAQGDLSFGLINKIENSQLEGSATLLLDQLQLGEKVDSQGAVKLPLDLALVLFRDVNGQISFKDVNISGDISQPGFSYSGIIAQAFGNLITKAAAAPFRFLGNSIGGLAGMGSSNDESTSAGDNERVLFETGSTEIDSDNPTLKKLSKYYNKHPLLNYEIQGFYNEAERAALIEKTFEQTVRSEWNSRPASIRETFARERPRIIRKLATASEIPTQDAEGKSLPLEELETALLETIQIEENALEQLAQDRALAVKESFMDQGIKEEDLFLVEPQATEEENPYVSLGVRP